jgi:tRNA pseudouridine55 synthase
MTACDGLLLIDKPRGITSHDVVQRVRRALQTRQVGHAGTLDPLATGLLVVCVGRATRLSEYLLGHDKRYRATIRLGTETDTYDADGRVTATQPVKVKRSDIDRALGRFVGAIEQVPPMHSAIKVGGEKLYDLARAGREVERPARAITIYAIEVIDFAAPDVIIDVQCSAGTYIRSLAHDLGAALGTGAHVAALRRTAAGPFGLDQAIGLAEFEAAVQSGDERSYLQPIDAALRDWPSITLNAAQQQRAVTGGRIEGVTLRGVHARAYDGYGRLIALLVFDRKKQWWRADKVFSPER